MPRKIEELLREEKNEAYYELATTLMLLFDDLENGNNGKYKRLIRAEDIAPYWNALYLLSGYDDKTKKNSVNVQQAVNTLGDFNAFLFQTKAVPEGGYKSNFQILNDADKRINNPGKLLYFLYIINNDFDLKIRFDAEEMQENSGPIIRQNHKKNDIKKNDLKSNEEIEKENKSFQPYTIKREDLRTNEEIEEEEKKNKQTEKKKKSDEKENNFGLVQGNDTNVNIIEEDIENNSSESSEEIEISLDKEDDGTSVVIGEEDALFNQELYAYEWIDIFRKNYNKDPNENPQLIAARIFATRILVNSVRGDKSTLKEKVSGRDIDMLAEALMNNKTFKDFTETAGDRRLRKLIGKYGHGGVLEDKFKEYIINLPAGKLENDRILDRFMPRIIDRIDVLKQRVKKCPANRGCKREIAEVILLRQMGNAVRRDPETLVGRIPTVTSLPKAVSSVTNTEAAASVSFNQNLRRDLAEGHGGLMIENMNAKTDNSPEKKFLGEVGKTISTEYMFNELQHEADYTLQLMYTNKEKGSKNTNEMKRLCRNAKEILAKAIILSADLSRANRKAAPEVGIKGKQLQIGMKYALKNKYFNDMFNTKEGPDKLITELQEFYEVPNPEAYAAGKLHTLQEMAAADKLNKEMGNKNPETQTQINGQSKIISI